MDYHGVRVLVTDGGARQTLTIVRGLKEIGCHVTVLCSSRLDVCYASKIPDVKILSKDAAGSYDGFESILMRELTKGKYDVLFPIAEITTNKVTQRENEIKQYVRLACAPRNSYEQAFNKQRTFEIAIDAGIPCPYTRRNGQSIEDFFQHANFPIIIKPRQGLGSIGFRKFATEADFWNVVTREHIDINDYVIQEFVQFEKRIGTYIFVDQNNEVTTSMAQEVLRWFPIDAGTAVLTRSVDAPEAIRYSEDLLKAMQWRGFANVGFMIDKASGESVLLEINGRISAGVKLTLMCGINIAKQLIQFAYDDEVTKYSTNNKFGLMARHSQADMTWFLKSKDRFKCNPSWFSWRNTKDLVFWRDDPMPYFAYTIQRLFRYKSITDKRKH